MSDWCSDYDILVFIVFLIYSDVRIAVWSLFLNEDSFNLEYRAHRGEFCGEGAEEPVLSMC